jgi:hypothetical protein
MTFSDTTNKSGIIQCIERLTNMGDAWISGTAARLAEFTNYVNEENAKVWHLIFMSALGWDYDDSNQTDLPIANGDFTDGTGVYALPTTALTVSRIEIADSSGDYYRGRPLTEIEVDTPFPEFWDADGIPLYYKLKGQTIEFYPAPDYTTTSNTGFKVYFDRGSVDFATTDTTQTPGFASPYHEILPIKAAKKWLMTKGLTNSWQQLVAEEQKLEAQLQQFYSKRFKDKVKFVGRAYQSFK